MSRVLHLLWALLIHLSAGILTAPVLNQAPMSGPVSAGQTVRLECRMQNGNVGRQHMSWYRQLPGVRPEWVIRHDYDDGYIARGTGITSRFETSRDTSSNSRFLTISRLESRDSVVYYCATWDSGGIFGPGTILDIKSAESRKPTTLLLPPSTKETGLGSATLSCLASGFKPALVTVRWNVDGVQTESGVTTGAVSPDTDQAYRLSSYLRVPAAAWNKGSSYSCSVSHSSLSSPLRNTISSSACAR